MTTLRERIQAISDDDLRLLVKVAFEGINDVDACREIADIVDMKPEDLLAFGERVAQPLSAVAEQEMGYYD